MNSIFSVGLFGIVLNLLFLGVFIFGVSFIVKSVNERNGYLKEILNELKKNNKKKNGGS